MFKTYTLLLRGEYNVLSLFEPVMCETNAELIGKARALLARYPECVTVDVLFGQTQLYCLRQEPRH